MVDEAQRERYPARLLSSTPLSPRATLIRVVVNGRYEYRPGQHVAISFADGGLDSYYSFASASDPIRPSEFELCVAIAGRPKHETLEPGRLVTVSEPLGGVSFSTDRVRPLWLFGIGTGVAPLRAIVQDRTGALSGVTLIAGHRDAEGSLFHDEFESKSQQGLDYRPFVSQERGAWSGGRGRIQDEVTRLIGSAGAEVQRVHAVICGKQDMVTSVKSLLAVAGVPERQVHWEGY